MQPIEEITSAEPFVPNITYTLPSPSHLAISLAPLNSSRFSKTPYTSRGPYSISGNLSLNTLNPSTIPAHPTPRPLTQQSLPIAKIGKATPSSTSEAEGDSLSPNFTLSSSKKAVHSKSTSNVSTSYNSQAFVSPPKRGSELDREIGKERESTKKRDATAKKKEVPKEREGGKIELAPVEPVSRAPARVSPIVARGKETATLTNLISENGVPHSVAAKSTNSSPSRVEIPEEILTSMRGKKDTFSDFDQVNGVDDSMDGYTFNTSKHTTNKFEAQPEGDDDGFYNPFPSKEKRPVIANGHPAVKARSEEKLEIKIPLFEALDLQTSPTSAQIYNPSTNGHPAVKARSEERLEIKIPLSDAFEDLHTSPSSTQIYNRPSTQESPPSLALDKPASKKKPKLPINIALIHTKSANTRAILVDGQASPCSGRLVGKKTSVLFLILLIL